MRVRPGENLPVDGRIVSGTSDINQASLTGEAVPIEASAGVEVYAGTTNLTGQIDVEVTAVAGETTIGKVENLIREAEQSKTERQELIEQLAAYYVPVVLMVAGVVWFFTARSELQSIRDEAAIRAITVLVVTCPGALLIAHPTAMVAAFASAARLGIMIKRTSTLEAAASVDTVVLDKTGTITTGRFAVPACPSRRRRWCRFASAAADAEQSSNHPLARSILETAERANLDVSKVSEYEEVHGRGVRRNAMAPPWLPVVAGGSVNCSPNKPMRSHKPKRRSRACPACTWRWAINTSARLVSKTACDDTPVTHSSGCVALASAESPCLLETASRLQSGSAVPWVSTPSRPSACPKRSMQSCCISKTKVIAPWLWAMASTMDRSWPRLMLVSPWGFPAPTSPPTPLALP